ncbi:hypothetical protein K440DRAFT_681363 [Wilcoxina mikolae CBS 423.85]|nr:hypothetical protein K440DRAFT_681363 [Wilcoxina mikolae CBS 423.85]
MPPTTSYLSPKNRLGLPTGADIRPTSIMTTTFRALERFVSDIREGKNNATTSTASCKRKSPQRQDSGVEVDPALVIDVGEAKSPPDQEKREVSCNTIGEDTPATETAPAMDGAEAFLREILDPPKTEENEPREEEMKARVADGNDFRGQREHEAEYKYAHHDLRARREGILFESRRADTSNSMGYSDGSRCMSAVSLEQPWVRSMSYAESPMGSQLAFPRSMHSSERINMSGNLRNYPPSTSSSNGYNHVSSQMQSHPRLRSNSQHHTHHASTVYGLNPDSLIVPPCSSAIRRPNRPVDLHLLSPPESPGSFSTHSPRSCSTPASTISTPAFPPHTVRTATPEMPPRSVRSFEPERGRAWSYGSRKPDSILDFYSGSASSYVMDGSAARKNILPRSNETPELMLEFPRAAGKRRYT